MKSIYIYGASGHGLVIEDLALDCGYEKILFIDDNDERYPSFSDIEKNTDIPVCIAIGDNKIRDFVYQKVADSGMSIATLIHPSAIISRSAKINRGSVVMPQVVINAFTEIGIGCIINSASVIEHENNIGNFVHVSPNTALGGNVNISDYAHLGIGAAIKQGISIGENTLIGAGSIVVQNIPAYVLAYGNPCKIQGKYNA